MDKPLVSIIIPVYNGQNYLQEAIDSALAQTYPNIEIIVMNDGSCDDGATEKIALSYGNKIRYFYKENGGVSTALNLAIQKMEGDYFSWLSHDDLYYPDKVERQIKALFEDGDRTRIVYSAYDSLDQATGEVNHTLHSKSYDIDQLTNSVFSVLQGAVHGCSLLIHKSHFERVGNFDKNLSTTQDYDLWFRMMRYQKLIYITEPLVIGRVHSTQRTYTVTCYKLEQVELYMKILKELTEEEIYSMYGNPYIFYHRMCCRFKGERWRKVYNYSNQKFQEWDAPEDLAEKLLILEIYIKQLSNEKACRICIFCVGAYGVSLYEELKDRLITVNCFADNNPEKWGDMLNGVPCISPRQLQEQKENTLVIVANSRPDDIVKQLTVQGFPYVTTKQELDKILFSIPPVKQMTIHDNINELD